MQKIILSEDDIKCACKRIGKALTEHFKDSGNVPVFVGVMKGALPFMMDLIREVNIPIELDFIQVSSYKGTESTGTIVLKRDVSCHIKNRDVVIIEDIVDTGFTMNYVTKYLKDKYSPKSITTVALLDKKCQRKLPFEVDYSGKVVENEFVIGYGLDYDELCRNIPYVCVPTKEEVEEYNEIIRTKL